MQRRWLAFMATQVQQAVPEVPAQEGRPTLEEFRASQLVEAIFRLTWPLRCAPAGPVP